jgi:hypothetical protein
VKYLRSRPWRSRGPWFSDRAGSRRRGRCDVLQSLVGDAGSGLERETDAGILSVPLDASATQHVDRETPFVPLSLSATRLGRIDESGLRELARRARDQASTTMRDRTSPFEQTSPGMQRGNEEPPRRSA